MHAVLIDPMQIQRDLWEKHLGKIPGLTLQLFENVVVAEEYIKNSLLEGKLGLIVTEQNLESIFKPIRFSEQRQDLSVNYKNPTGIDLIDRVDIFCAENELPIPHMLLVSLEDRTSLRAALDQKGLTEIPILDKKQIHVLSRLVEEIVSPRNTPEG